MTNSNVDKYHNYVFTLLEDKHGYSLTNHDLKHLQEKIEYHTMEFDDQNIWKRSINLIKQLHGADNVSVKEYLKNVSLNKRNSGLTSDHLKNKVLNENQCDC